MLGGMHHASLAQGWAVALNSFHNGRSATRDRHGGQPMDLQGWLILACAVLILIGLGGKW